MLPNNLALIDDDSAFSGYLVQFLRGRGVAATWFPDSDDLLCSAAPFGFDFYIVDLMLPGVDGESLVRLLRRRSEAGILVVSGKEAEGVFASAISSGADMHLKKPVSFEQILLGIAGVYRRTAAFTSKAEGWRLDGARATLTPPAGAPIEISQTDALVLGCLAEAAGATVSRERLAQVLDLPPDDPNLLNATIYRLRRRIEKATGMHAPLQARSRAGYVFRAPLVAVASADRSRDD